MAASQDTLVVTQAYTVSGNGPQFPVQFGSMAHVTIPITAGSGTVADFDAWLEGSTDNGTTWTRLLANRIDENGTDVTTARSNIVNNKASTAAGVWGAYYDFLACMLVRGRWAFTGGSSPSLTFGMQIGLK